MSVDKLYLLTIKAKNENGIRIITILPTFQILNKTSVPMHVATMSLFDFHVKKSYDFHHCHLLQPDMETPVSLLKFEIRGQMTGDQILFDGFQAFAFKSDDSNWSEPMNLGECRNATKDDRKVISLPLAQNGNLEPCNRLHVITMHQRNGQVFLVLQDQCQSQLVVHNNLNSKIVFYMSGVKGKFCNN